MEESIKSFPKIVVDASIVLAFLLPDEKRLWIDRLFIEYKMGKIKMLSPNILYYEVLNGIRSALLRKRIPLKLAKSLIKKFLKIEIDILEIRWKKAFSLALKHNLSFYDAAYLSLAKKEKIPLLTLDKLLLKKAEVV